MDVVDEFADVFIEFACALEGIGGLSDAAVGENRIAGIEDQFEIVGLDVVEEAEGVEMGLSAVIHAVFVSVDDSGIGADPDELTDLAEDDFFEFGAVELLVSGEFEAHAAEEFDPEFLHPGDGGEEFVFRDGEILVRTGRLAPVGDAAAVAVERDAGAGNGFQRLFKFLIGQEAEKFFPDETGLDEFPAQLTGGADLFLEIVGSLVGKTCQEHFSTSLC